MLLGILCKVAQADDDASSGTSLPAGVRVVRDVPYGSDPAQRFDVYAAIGVQDAPVIFMVHGGAWMLGDKSARAVVENKVARWVPKGFIVISANYRMLPRAMPVEQARDVGKALATAQKKAATWGGDRTRFILMGHSAGAHLVALLTAWSATCDGNDCAGVATAPWLASVLLDSAALDVVQRMEQRHPRLYDRVFGRDPEYWKAASPFHALNGGTVPILAVCSSLRDDPCPQADRFAAKAVSSGMRASVLKQPLSHKDINQHLGQPGDYTNSVEAFLRTVDAAVSDRLR
ncbi:alpha/beta hydrolase [Noviherbaspirillum cavernae]|nr:alpha/beta hydrolase [Noviherbaspirillum cavernae]